MTVRSKLLASVLTSAALLAGCDSVASTDVATDQLGLFVFVDVDADANAAVTARLTTDNPSLLEVTYVRLEGGDALWASLPIGAPKAMTEHTLLGFYEYLASFSGVTGGMEINVGLDRATHVDAPTSKVTVPGALDITASAATFALASGVTLSWTGGAGATDIAIAIRSTDACFDDFTRTATVAAGQLRLSSADFTIKPSAPTTCAITAEIAAVAHGTADAAYGRGGNVTARQTRRLTLSMTR